MRHVRTLTGRPAWPLRSKVALILLGVFVLYVGLAYTTYYLALSPGFARLEEQEARRELSRCEFAVQRELRHLDRFALEWASWDDTWHFVETRDQAYAAANLSEAALADNQLAALYLLGPDGRIVWNRSRPPIDGAAQDGLPADPWPPNHPLLCTEGRPGGRTGLLLAGQGAVLVAARPILRSDGTGPPRGTLVMARPLDPAMMDLLDDPAGARFNIIPLSSEALTGEQRSALADLSGGAPAVFRRESADYLNTYSMLPDVYGIPAVLLHARTVRDISHEGAASVRLAVVFSLVAGLVLLGVLLAFLSRAVVRPLATLTAHAVAVNRSGDLSARLHLARGDELGVLAREYDAMMARLERDAASRAGAEAALRESESRYRAILESAADGILTVEANGSIMTTNPAAEAMFAYPGGGAIGLPITRLLPEFDLAHADTGHAVEVRGVRKGGDAFPLHLTVGRVALPGRDLATLIVRDISDAKRLQERALRNQHLALLGEMGASVAHEIRNPLAGISGAVQVLRGGLPSGDERRGVLDEVLAEAARLDAIVRDLLQFARPWTPEVHPCDLDAVLRTVIERARRDDAFASIDFDLPPSAPVVVPADRSLVEQVLWNLLTNAAQAMPAGGRIACAFTAANGAARLAVRDTGPGIPSDLLDKVLNPFFTTRTRGTGLGLAVCRRVMEAHGGSIDVTNAPAGGAEVILAFPTGEGLS